MGDKIAYKFWWGKLKERDHLEDIPFGARIILKLS
jgi:hypothetical protein